MPGATAESTRQPIEWISGIHTADRPRVVIIGAGFDGLWAARALRRFAALCAGRRTSTLPWGK